MKRIKVILMFAIFIFIAIISNNVFAADDITKLLYQDITINQDGSITIKEATWLQGKYNGRAREIEFKNRDDVRFTGAYSNFTGDCDIYDGSGIKDIKVYDISQENFTSFEDINKIEKNYEKVKNASNGKYGVYTINENEYGIDLKIFCPDNKKKVICIEYTITDAVVLHNDTAELYWAVIGSNYREKVEDFQVIIHLPNEDNNARIWTHGPLSGENKIIDSNTLSFTDNDVNAYKKESIRIMFDKSLVPYATKKSNIDGVENILKYEASMAIDSNNEREKLNLENEAIQAVFEFEEEKESYYYEKALSLINQLDNNDQKNELLEKVENVIIEMANEKIAKLEEYPDGSYYYDDAMNFINEISDNNHQKKNLIEKVDNILKKEIEEVIFNVERYTDISYYNEALELINKLNEDYDKNEYIERINKYKKQINEEWKELLEYSVESITEKNYKNLNEDNLNFLKWDVEQGFDENVKKEYNAIILQLEEKLKEKYEKIRMFWTGVIFIGYGILILAVVLEIDKIIRERHTFKEYYYRDFPSEDNPYIIEYLMKKKITYLSFSATILNLVAKKVIKFEKDIEDSKNIKLVLADENIPLSAIEKFVKETVIDTIGDGRTCSIKQMKKYAKNKLTGPLLKKKIDRFYDWAKSEAEYNGYFEKISMKKSLKLYIVLHYIIALFILFLGVCYKTEFGESKMTLLIMTIVTIISFIMAGINKHRTPKGKLEYSKWLAHQRYLKDFSNFDEKDLPEVSLWEKYFVTATILECADKVENKLKLYIKENEMYNNDFAKYNEMDYELIDSLNKNIKTTILVSRNTAKSIEREERNRDWRKRR